MAESSRLGNAAALDKVDRLVRQSPEISNLLDLKKRENYALVVASHASDFRSILENDDADFPEKIPWLRQIDEFENLKPEPKVVLILILGTSGAGKSTTISALIQENIIPVGNAGNAVTAIPIEIRSSTKLKKAFKFTGFYIDETEVARILTTLHQAATSQEIYFVDTQTFEAAQASLLWPQYVNQLHVLLQQDHGELVRDACERIAIGQQISLYDDSPESFASRIAPYVDNGHSEGHWRLMKRAQIVLRSNGSFLDHNIALADLPGKGNVEFRRHFEIPKDCALGAMLTVAAYDRAITEKNAQNCLKEAAQSVILNAPEMTHDTVLYVTTKWDTRFADASNLLAYLKTEQAARNFVDDELFDRLQSLVQQSQESLVPGKKMSLVDQNPADRENARNLVHQLLEMRHLIIPRILSWEQSRIHRDAKGILEKRCREVWRARPDGHLPAASPRPVRYWATGVSSVAYNKVSRLKPAPGFRNRKDTGIPTVRNKCMCVAAETNISRYTALTRSFNVWKDDVKLWLPDQALTILVTTAQKDAMITQLQAPIRELLPAIHDHVSDSCAFLLTMLDNLQDSLVTTIQEKNELAQALNKLMNEWDGLSHQRWMAIMNHKGKWSGKDGITKYDWEGAFHSAFLTHITGTLDNFYTTLMDELQTTLVREVMASIENFGERRSEIAYAFCGPVHGSPSNLQRQMPTIQANIETRLKRFFAPFCENGPNRFDAICRSAVHNFIEVACEEAAARRLEPGEKVLVQVRQAEFRSCVNTMYVEIFTDVIQDFINEQKRSSRLMSVSLYALIDPIIEQIHQDFVLVLNKAEHTDVTGVKRQIQELLDAIDREVAEKNELLLNDPVIIDKELDGTLRDAIFE